MKAISKHQIVDICQLPSLPKAKPKVQILRRFKGGSVTSNRD